MIELIIALAGGALAGYIGAITSSGGLLSLPLLIFLGLPAPIAIATNRFSAFGLLMAAIPKYSKAKKIEWQLAYVLMPLALLGGLIGSNLVVGINKDLLSNILAISLLLVLPVVFFVKKPSGRLDTSSRLKRAAGYTAYFSLMIYGGLVGAGMGMLLVICLFYFFHLSYLEAVATNFAAWFIMSVAALTVFIANGLVDYKVGIPMGIGMYIGGQIGSAQAIKKGDKLVRLFLVVVVVASAVKLLF